MLHHKFEKAPRFLQIETTVVCPGKCFFCPQKKVTRKPLQMDWKLIEKILTETRGLGLTYRPFLLNEPFADPRMAEIISLIKKDPGARVEFNTNAALLPPRLTDKILEAGVDVMRFSVDGITRKTFDETRGISFDAVYTNVQYFIERAQNLKHPVQYEVRMIRLPGTEEEQEVFKEFWEAKGTKVVFTDLYRYPWEGQTEAICKPCLKIFDESFIYVDGRVTLCCWDTNERAVIGDVNRENLLDIWNGPVLKKYRDFLAVGDRNAIPLCSRCDAYKNLDFSKVKPK